MQLLVAILVLVWGIFPVFAEDAALLPNSDPVAKTVEVETSQEPVEKVSENSHSPVKRKVRRENEAAEGTHALRSIIRKNAIIKSRYELNGQPLEVDTE